jgi:hypothetical protein
MGHIASREGTSGLKFVSMLEHRPRTQTYNRERLMVQRVRRIVIVGFALWIVALSGIVYPQLTEHIGQHEHHKAATHATVLCSWLCISADAVGGTVVELAPVQFVTFLVQTPPVTEFHLPHGPQPPSRAPPLL